MTLLAEARGGKPARISSESIDDYLGIAARAPVTDAKFMNAFSELRRRLVRTTIDEPDPVGSNRDLNAL